MHLVVCVLEVDDHGSHALWKGTCHVFDSARKRSSFVYELLRQGVHEAMSSCVREVKRQEIVERRYPIGRTGVPSCTILQLQIPAKMKLPLITPT